MARKVRWRRLYGSRRRGRRGPLLDPLGALGALGALAILVTAAVAWVVWDVTAAPVIGVVGLILLAGQYQLHRRQARLLRHVAKLPEAVVRQMQEMEGLRRSVEGEPAIPALVGGALAPDNARRLVEWLERCRPGLVLELGSGASTVLAASVLKRLGTGRIVSLEHDPGYAARTRHELEVRGLDSLVDLRCSPLRPVRLGGAEWQWYSTDDLPEPGVAALIVDGPPGTLARHARYPALPLVAPLLDAGAEVFVDDADRDDEREVVARWLDEYPGAIAKHFETTRGLVIVKWNGPRAGESPAPTVT